MAIYRTFDGKRFRAIASFPKRGDAEYEAMVRRRRGWQVRVVPVKGGYALYVKRAGGKG